MNIKLKKNIIILLGTTRQTGKSTLAHNLARNFERSFTHSFAAPLRMAVTGALRHSFQEFGMLASEAHATAKLVTWTEDQDLKERVTRPLLISFGDALKHGDPLILFNHWKRSVRHLLKDGPGVVIAPDWRFDYELAGCYGMDAVTLPYKIERPEAPLPTEPEVENTLKIVDHFGTPRTFIVSDSPEATASRFMHDHILPDLDRANAIHSF